jgi:WD40 repeat protein
MPDLSPALARARFCAALCLLLCALTSTSLARQSPQPTPVLQLGHNPSALALSPDGRFAVTGGYRDGLLKWWDRKTGLLIRSVAAHNGVITEVAFDGGGTKLLSGGVDGFVRLWDAATGQRLLEFRASTGSVECAAFSPRGDVIATCAINDQSGGVVSHPIKLWDARTGLPLRTLGGHAKLVSYLAFDPSGQTLASTGEDRTLRLWSVAAGAQLFSVPVDRDGWALVTFSPDGRTIAASASKGNPERSELVFFDARTGARLRSFGADEFWFAKAMSADWRHFVAGGDDEFKVWDMARGTFRQEQVKGFFPKAAFSADGSTLALIGGGGASPLFWPSLTPAGSRPETPLLTFTTGLAVNSARRLVAWGSGTEAYVWDATSSNLLRVMKGHTGRINEVAFSPDGRTMASCSNDEVKLWSADDGSLLGDLKVFRPSNVEEYNWDGSQSVAFSPDGRLLATGELKVTALKQRGEYKETLAIRLWDVATRRFIKRFELPPKSNIKLPTPEGEKDPPYWIRSITFGRDNRTIASDDGTNGVLLLDTDTATLRVLGGHQREVNSVAFSADGKRLVSASFDKTLKVWDVATGRAVRTLRGHTDRATTARFSPDGRVVISGGLDRTVRLWDASGGAPLSVLANHEEAVTSAAVGPDGRTIFTTGLDGRVSLWSLPGRSLAATLLADSDGTWVCVSPDGYYKGNDAEKYLGWRVGDEMYPASAYREQFAKPDALLARLNWKPTEPPAPRATPTPVASLRPTPTPTARPTPTSTPPVQPPAERGVGVRMKAQSGQTYTVQLYKNSYAMVIGNSNYDNWTKLPGVYQDLDEVSRALTRQGFQVVKFDDRGKPVFGHPVRDVTRAEFNRQLELFIDQYGQGEDKGEDNRLLIYYAGHGYTALLPKPDGRKMGYLVMTDAPPMPSAENALKGDLTYQQLAPFRRASVNMDEIETFAKDITARHALFVFDSCFAGTVLFRDGEVAVPGYLGEDVTQPVREFLTAGNERQRVSDDSAFRKAFVSGIEGAADMEDRDHRKDGYVLATELYLYVAREVRDYTGGRQTPVFGKILKQELARGDFVFVYPVSDK